MINLWEQSSSEKSLKLSTEWDTYGNDLSHDVDRQTTSV